MARPIDMRSAGGSTAFGSGSQVLAGWRRVFKLLGERTRGERHELKASCGEPIEKEHAPFIVLSPFGGFYHRPRR